MTSAAAAQTERWSRIAEWGGGAAVVVLVAVLAFRTVQPAPRLDNEPDRPPAPLAASPASVPATTPPAETGADAWTRPQGEGFDLFTAPALFCDTVTGELRWDSPPAAGGAAAERIAELDVLEVHTVDLELRLVGFVGGDKGWAVFEDLAKGCAVLARPRHAWPERGLVLERFWIDEPERTGDSRLPQQAIGWAEIQVASTGATVRLATNGAGPGELSYARVRLADGTTRQCGEGAVLAVQGSELSIESISPNDQVVVLTRRSADGAQTRHRLPVAPDLSRPGVAPPL